MTNNDVIHTVREIITALIPNKPPYLPIVGLGENLADIDFDSLSRHEIADTIEMYFEIDIDDDVPETWTTVQDVVDSVTIRIIVTSQTSAK